MKRYLYMISSAMLYLLNIKAAYLETGVWAKKAIKEAKFFGEVL